MSRSHRRISTEEIDIGSTRQAPVARFDDKVFSKFQLEKVTSKETQHTCLAWLSDGSALVIGGSDGGIQVFSSEKLSSTWSIDTSTHSGVSHIAANPQRPSLITAAFRDSKRGEDGSLRSFDVRSKSAPNPKLYTRIHSDLLAMAFHPDGTRLLAVHRSGTVTLYDMHKALRKEGGTASVIKERLMPFEVNGARFSPDGSVIIAAYGVAHGNGMIGGLSILSAEDLSVIAEHGAHAAPAISVAQAAPRGRRHIVALGGNDGVATVWDMKSMAVATPLPIVDRPVRRLDLSADGSMLALGGTRETKTGAHDGIDLALVDHDDIFGRPRIHRVDLGHMHLMDLAWSPRLPVLAVCGDVVSEGYQRSTKEPSYISHVWLYRQRGS